jgi:predicted transcriptional regulator
MPSVHIKSPRLSPDQKKRIGDKVISVLQGEGFFPGSVVVFFHRETADMLLDGGLLFEAESEAEDAPAPIRAAPAAPVPAPVALKQAAAPTPVPPPLPEPEPELAAAEPDPEPRGRQRRSKNELSDLKAQLVKTLQQHGVLSSFQAQEQLGLKSCDWAPATLRRFFSELEEEGVISKQGQKRGTRYVWKGTSHQTRSTPSAKLVKQVKG